MAIHWQGMTTLRQLNATAEWESVDSSWLEAVALVRGPGNDSSTFDTRNQAGLVIGVAIKFHNAFTAYYAGATEADKAELDGAPSKGRDVWQKWYYRPYYELV